MRIVLLVGTNKGVFLFHSDAHRREWRRTGPHLSGWEVSSLLGEPGGRRLLAGAGHMAYGPTIRVSDDLGESWTQMLGSPSYKKESGRALKRIWQIVPGAPSQPGTLYAGVDEAGLFVSRDRGVSWEEVAGLAAHPSRPHWEAGKGGICLHSILVDPTNSNRMWVGISTAGVFRTEDGGKRWKTCHTGLPSAREDHPWSEVGRNVHKMVLDPRDASTLYLQFFWGVYKSTDGADSWVKIERGLPSTFGFPLAVTRSGDLFVIPLEGEDERYMKDGKLRVFRSRNGGESWEPCQRGLPEQPNYVSVLRDALAVDPLDPPGVYFGTTSGEMYYSPDTGENWTALPGQYSRITVVKTWVIHD